MSVAWLDGFVLKVKWAGGFHATSVHAAGCNGGNEVVLVGAYGLGQSLQQLWIVQDMSKECVGLSTAHLDVAGA